MNETPESQQPVPQLQIKASRGLVDWLINENVSIAISTYQAGKLFLIGHNDQGNFSVFERTFERVMGLTGDDQTIYMATLFQLWRLENVLAPGETMDNYDRSYVPQVANTTGDLDIHDIALDSEGNLVFVSPRFNCVATLSDRFHFKPIWMPKFISKLAGEDRCHLNGLAVVDGKPRYATACAANRCDGWVARTSNHGWCLD